MDITPQQMEATLPDAIVIAPGKAPFVRDETVATAAHIKQAGLRFDG